jgi:hypothetical protein
MLERFSKATSGIGTMPAGQAIERLFQFGIGFNEVVVRSASGSAAS